MTMVRTLCTLLALCLLAAPARADDPAVRVETTIRDGHVFVSFHVTGDMPEEVRASIQSGLPTTFAYDVVLREETSWWVDRTLASARVSAVVRFDNLTRRYQVTLIEDGRVEEVRTTDDEAMALQWMTVFRARRLASVTPLEHNGEYYVRVLAHARPRGLSWPWPFNRTPALGSVSFRFLP
jgi:hypothetical protein